jgi:hypothetical protein
MAQYMFLLFDTEEFYDNLTPEDWQATMKLHNAFSEAVEAAGASIFGGAALERSTTASTVKQQAGGEPIVTDGPFIETKEALGGFYLVECKDLDEAIEVASKIPGAQTGTIEIRPIWDM